MKKGGRMGGDVLAVTGTACWQTRLSKSIRHEMAGAMTGITTGKQIFEPCNHAGDSVWDVAAVEKCFHAHPAVAHLKRVLFLSSDRHTRYARRVGGFPPSTVAGPADNRLELRENNKTPNPARMYRAR